MRAEVRVPTVLQDIVGGSRAVPAEGETVEEIFDSMESRYPGFKARLIDEKGGLHDFVSLCLNDEDIRFMKGIKTPIRDGDIITIVPSMVGTPSKAREETKETVRVDQEINLKGEVCPYTFLKSLLALEEMETGHVLRVIVDYLPSVENVPQSLKNEGHEIVQVKQINDTDWAITARKLDFDEEE